MAVCHETRCMTEAKRTGALPGHFSPSQDVKVGASTASQLRQDGYSSLHRFCELFLRDVTAVLVSQGMLNPITE